MKNLGTKIRNAREDMDLYQRDMARLIPMNQSNYSKIERGTQEPSLEQLKRICQILNLDPKFLLGLGEDEATSAYELVTDDDLKLLADVKDLIRKHQEKQ